MSSSDRRASSRLMDPWLLAVERPKLEWLFPFADVRANDTYMSIKSDPPIIRCFVISSLYWHIFKTPLLEYSTAPYVCNKQCSNCRGRWVGEVEPLSSLERPPGSGKFQPPRGGAVAATLLAHITGKWQWNEWFASYYHTSTINHASHVYRFFDTFRL